MRKLLLKLISILAGILSVSASVTTPTEKTSYTAETIIFNSISRGEEKSVIAMIALPLRVKGPLPVIITQHGSSRDGITV
jgi:hypothetical protein